MKAIVQTGYGSPDGFELRKIAKPRIKKDNDVLVRVHAAALHAGDVFMMRGVPVFTRFMVGFPKPKDYIPGYDLAGVVEAVGVNVSRFKRGDEVFGAVDHTCAEYVVASEEKLELIPSNLTLEQAAAVPTSAIAALHGIRDAGKVKPGQKVLINGASGGVGTFAVQIAKAYGAEVTGVCSTRNVEMVRSIGADHVIDYTQEDFTQGGPRYDLILDQVANHSLSACRRVLTPTGQHIPNSGNSGMSYILKALAVSMFVRRQGSTYMATPKPKDLPELRALIESGKVTPVIDRTVPMEEFNEAMRHLDSGRASGKIVLTL
ncbi:MAG: NAD(P)-dependent alcohol dehydrogenase [Candidatus Atribacteria bacterium]|nr:MAG: NAD(P)-dependent alcohol dehydrogenase [Candidatus Atribacteria bacterium]